MHALSALVGFTLWTLLLVTAIGAVRVSLVLMKKKRPNEFPASVQHGGDLYWRLNRAHLNATENLPIFGALVLTGTALGVDTPAFHGAATVVLVARIVQSLFHVSSGRSLIVNFRFAAFATQVCCCIAIALQDAMALAAIRG